MSLKLKVCGLREKDNINELIDNVSPDFIGLITYEKSPRFMLEALENVPDFKGVSKVGVFVNETIATVKSVVEKYNLDYAQLHGSEEVQYCQKLKTHGIGVIKVFRVLNELPIHQMEGFLTCSDYFLLDTKTPKHGGSGQKFDWNILKEYPFQKPFFLSGGIAAEDAEVINKLNIPALYALDINSKFELAPGHKDVALVKTFKDQLA